MHFSLFSNYKESSISLEYTFMATYKSGVIQTLLHITKVVESVIILIVLSKKAATINKKVMTYIYMTSFL